MKKKSIVERTVTLRLLPEDLEYIRIQAAASGMSVAELMASAVMGKPACAQSGFICYLVNSDSLGDVIRFLDVDNRISVLQYVSFNTILCNMHDLLQMNEMYVRLREMLMENVRFYYDDYLAACEANGEDSESWEQALSSLRNAVANYNSI